MITTTNLSGEPGEAQIGATDGGSLDRHQSRISSRNRWIGDVLDRDVPLPLKDNRSHPHSTLDVILETRASGRVVFGLPRFA
jgi:hypothetical protein